MTKRRPAWFYWLVGAIGTNRAVSRLHAILYRATGGRWLLGRNLGVTNVVIETVGRRSGKVRHIPLFAFEEGERLAVIGSDMGHEREPAWVGNLRAHPDVRVRVGRDLRAMRARETEGAERDSLWALATRRYPGYDDYASWTTRQIPVVVLEPRRDA